VSGEEPSAAVLAAYLEALSKDVDGMKSALEEARRELPRLSATQGSQSDSVKRLFDNIRDVEKRLYHLEITLPVLEQSTRRSSGWIDKLLWACVALLSTLIVALLMTDIGGGLQLADSPPEKETLMEALP
jgi:hypothetical protein